MEEKSMETTMPTGSEDAGDLNVKKLVKRITCTGGTSKEEDFAPYEKSDKNKELEAVKVAPGFDLPTPQPDLEKLLPKPDPEKPSPKLDPENQLPDKTDAPAKVEAGDARTELEHKVHQLKLEDPCQYHMEHKARGKFVLFNVVNFIGREDLKRDGSNVDAEQLEATFRRMHFEVERYDDPTGLEMVNILKEVATKDHTSIDCVAVGILTHGDWTIYQRASDQNMAIADRVLASDGPITLDLLTSLFRVKNCHRSLRGKPKLFFIQACRGHKLGERAEYYDPREHKWLPNISNGNGGHPGVDSGIDDSDSSTTTVVPTTIEKGKEEPENEAKVQAEESVQEAKAQEESDEPEDTGDDGVNWMNDRQAHSLPECMPIYKDFLVAWATAPGYMSSRNGYTGSIFIQTLCHYLDEFHSTTDLLSILTWCNSDIAHQFQFNTPTTNPSMHGKKQMPWYFSRLTKEILFKRKGNISQ